MDRNVNIVTDLKGNKIVPINDIVFKGKRSVKWDDVKNYQMNTPVPDIHNDSHFALPIYDDNGEVERYNVFHASMLIRHDVDGKMYLYDVIDIKKKRAPLSNHKILLGKNPSLFL